jgi:hypothetical protein
MCPTDTITSSELDEIRLDPIETRRAPRHRLKRGFIAFGSENFGEIVNISQTGIAIEFMAHKDAAIMDISEINLINNLEGYLLGELGCITVYTSDTPSYSTGSVTVTRRIGMRFTPMDENQQSHLSTLLENYSDGEYSTLN